MKTYSKTLYYKTFSFLISYNGEPIEDYIKFEMHFDFKEGLRFTISTSNMSICRRKPKKALFEMLEKQIIGYDRYQILKEDCINEGLWRQLK